MKPLRLFAIRKVDSTQHIEGLYFMDQKHAKRERDAMNHKTGEAHVLCPGPDHKRYKETK